MNTFVSCRQCTTAPPASAFLAQGPMITLLIALHCIALHCIALHILIMMMIIIITRPWSTKAGDDDPDGVANADDDDDCGDDDDDGDDAFINGTISLQ